MKWTEVNVTVPARAEEAAAACVLAAGCGSVQVLRDEPLPELDEAWSTSTPKSAAPAERVTIRAYLPEGADPCDAIRQALANSGLLEANDVLCRLETVDDSAWSGSWKRFHRPRRVGKRFLLRATWSKPRLRPGDIELIVDPGMAFGSGQHATTRLCLEALEETVFEGARVLDVGCGSGVLSIAALKLGANSALAMDTDPVAVTTTLENARINGVADGLHAVCGTLQPPAPPAEIVVANILAGVVAELLAPVRNCLIQGAAGGRLPAGGYPVFISSGITRASEDRLLRLHTERGFQVMRRLHRGEWCCLVARPI